eukprot:GFUD01021047.1.p1 GENE.GFUD01021047.1~~GFUD01021047.1.p1  ORF type:complete len:406 (+),score=100.38 GFUD01021047.1:169-1386(+)
MPFNQRLKIFEAIKGSTIHQSLATPSSQAAMGRCQSSIITDPSQTMELLRTILQPDINIKIQILLNEYLESHFKPAFRNMKTNLGEENVHVKVLDEVCANILENAKEVFQTKVELAKKQNRGKSPGQVLKRSSSSASNSPVSKKSCVIKSGLGRPNTDLILVNKAGRPVRREGPKWEPERLEKDTLFILGSRANKALGFGQTRGRLYIKHPELFKYSGDQTDKEWLAKANLMATTGGKAYLMVLNDILQLAESPEYSSHPKQQPGELVGFNVPEWMIEKMKAYIETAKTNPDTTDEELLRIAEEYAEMEEDSKLRKPCPVRREDSDISLDWGSDTVSHSHSQASQNVAQLLQEMKGETMDDDLQNLDPAFLQGMNLHNLVREFEMEASGGGSDLGILALADDCLN